MRAEAKALVLGFAPRWLGHRDLQHGGSADTCPLLREQGRFFPDRSPRLRIAAQPAAPHLHGRFNTNTIPLDDVDAVMNDCVTISSKGRSVSIHPDEALLIELRAWLLNIRLLMLVGGKADEPAISERARISSIFAVAQWSTICTF